MKTKPWLTEPATLTWTDQTTGLKCSISRNPDMLFLCGYVMVPAASTLHKVHGSREGLMHMEALLSLATVYATLTTKKLCG